MLIVYVCLSVDDAQRNLCRCAECVVDEADRKKKEKCWMLFSWWKIYRPYYSYYTFVCPSACVLYMSFASVCPCATCNRCPPLSLSLLPASVILSHFLRRTLTEFRVSRELSATLLLIIYVKIWQLKDELVRVFHSHFATVLLWPTAKCRCLYIHDTSYMWWIILTPDVAFSFFSKTKRESRQQASQFVK